MQLLQTDMMHRLKLSWPWSDMSFIQGANYSKNPITLQV